MEGGKKRVKDFSQTNGNRVFVDCNNHIFVEVNILGILTKMRKGLKVVSWEEFNVLGYAASSQQNTVMHYDALSYPKTTFLGLSTIILVEFSPGL